MNEELKRVGKNILLVAGFGGLVGGTVYTMARAAGSGESLFEAFSANNTIEPTANVNGGSTTDAERQLTTQEIDKIIDDLRLTGNIDNIIEKLDEIIKRAELMGNDALKDYATNTRSAYELQKQLDSLKGLIEAQKTKNSNIKSIDETLKRVLAVDTKIEDLQGAVSNEALMVLESIAGSDVKKLQDVMAEIEDYVDIRDINTLDIKQRTMLDLLILDTAIKNDLIAETRLPVAKDAITVAVNILKAFEKQRYLLSEYNSLAESSQRFSRGGRKSKLVLPEQVALLDSPFPLTRAPIMYDNHILISLDDLYKNLDSRIEFMYNSSTMVIHSPGKILEITNGKNIAYVNDEPKNIAVPILNVNETIYMSAEFFAETYGVSYRYLPEHEFLVMYKNLNQLKDPSVPNQINKD